MQVPDDCIHVDDLPDVIREDASGIVADAILAGHFDAAVHARARDLGWAAPDEARGDVEAEVVDGVEAAFSHAEDQGRGVVR